MQKWPLTIILLSSSFGAILSLPVPEISDDIAVPNLFSSEVDDINIGEQKAALLEVIYLFI